MNISEAIEKLQQIRADHGDMPVRDQNGYAVWEITYDRAPVNGMPGPNAVVEVIDYNEE